MSYYCENPDCPDPYLGFDRRRFKCARCTELYYCSPECQKAHWKVHKSYCLDYKTTSIVKLDLLERPACRLNEKVGAHKHPTPKLTKKHKEQMALLCASIRNLPEDDRHRLSCSCNLNIRRAGKNCALCFKLDPDQKYAKIYVTATCSDSACVKRATTDYPLLILQKPENLPNFEAYAVVPYLDFPKAHISLLNCDCNGLDEMLKTHKVSWIRKASPTKKFAYYVGTMIGTKFKMMPSSGIWS